MGCYHKAKITFLTATWYQDLMAPGNQVITTGRETAARGAKLFAQGEKTYLDNKATPSVAKQGINMMSDGFKIAQDGKEMIKKGAAMNDQVAQGKGALDKFAQGNQVIKTGMETMAGGPSCLCRVKHST